MYLFNSYIINPFLQEYFDKLFAHLVEHKIQKLLPVIVMIIIIDL